MSKEYKIWNGLIINNSQMITGVTDDSGLTNQSYVLPTSNAIKGYVDNTISIETSLRTSESSSIASSISGILSIEESKRISVDSSLSSAITGETSLRTSVDTSLTTALSNEISRSVSVDTSLSTSLSTEYSQRTSADSSLTTSLSTEISSSNSLHTLLNDNISIEESTRISADSSLSSSISTKLSISGGTVSPTFYLNGLTDNATLTDVLYYNTSTSGITHGTKPSSGSGTPGGLNTYVQFNSGSTFSGSSNLVFNGSDLTVGGRFYVSSLSYSSQTNMVYYNDITKEFSYSNNLLTITSTGSSYTLQLSDNGKIIEFTDNATLTLPNGLPNGFKVDIMNMGSSKTITLSAATTLLSKDSKITITSQYGGISIYNKGSDIWVAVGDLV